MYGIVQALVARGAGVAIVQIGALLDITAYFGVAIRRVLFGPGVPGKHGRALTFGGLIQIFHGRAHLRHLRLHNWLVRVGDREQV